MQVASGMTSVGQSGPFQHGISWKELAVEFVHRDVKVEEARIPHACNKDRFTLAWVRSPIEHTMVNGKANPMFFVDCERGQEDEARQSVRQAFDAYWFGGQPEVIANQTWRDRPPLL